MRKGIITTLSIAILLAQLAMPFLALAAETTNFLNIVPCGQSSDPNIATNCGLDHFIIVIRNIINALIILAIPMTMIVLTWIGIILLTAQGDSGKITRAKATLWKVVVGFIILVTAWLVVQALYLAITGVNFNTFFKRK